MTALSPRPEVTPDVDGVACVRFDLTTVIVNWNTVDLLDACIDSVRSEVPEGLTHQLVVVDNDSSDGSAAWL
ncbi:MAG: hypothetical protein KDB24_12910, partial [Microthrixaceae bacterium]|nr:hypothetical protein [Microthrixaceae bacterium]